MSEPKYPNPAAEGVVGKAVSGRAEQIDAAESAALGQAPKAAPAPAQPKTPSLLERVKSAIGMTKADTEIQKFAKGGRVKGPGTGTSDSVPARLSKGEYVVPAKAAKRIGYKQLDKMSHNPANKVAPRTRHRNGWRGMDGGAARMKCGGKVK